MARTTTTPSARDDLRRAILEVAGTLQEAARMAKIDPSRLSGLLAGRLAVGQRRYAGRASEAERIAALVGWPVARVVEALQGDRDA